jgi:hypothetical protein
MLYCRIHSGRMAPFGSIYRPHSKHSYIIPYFLPLRSAEMWMIKGDVLRDLIRLQVGVLGIASIRKGAANGVTKFDH